MAATESFGAHVHKNTVYSRLCGGFTPNRPHAGGRGERAPMEELLKSLWGIVATIVEGAAALLIAIGAAEAFAMSLLRFRAPTAQKMKIWMHFASWLLLGLEFELAADVYWYGDCPDILRHRSSSIHRRDPYVSKLLPG